MDRYCSVLQRGLLRNNGLTSDIHLNVWVLKDHNIYILLMESAG